MPAQQRRRRHDKRLPTRARQQSAGNGEQHPVDGGDRRTARGAPKDREFVPQDDDFEILELLRPSAQSHEFEQPAKQHIRQRHEHEASYVARLRPNSTHQPYPIRFLRSGIWTGSEFVHPSGFLQRCLQVNLEFATDRVGRRSFSALGGVVHEYILEA